MMFISFHKHDSRSNFQPFMYILRCGVIAICLHIMLIDMC